MSNQSNLQQSIRDITGTALDYNSDWSALFDMDGISTAKDWNGRLLDWINQELSSSHTNLPAAMQAYAEDQGVTNWSAISVITPAAGGTAGQPIGLLLVLTKAS